MLAEARKGGQEARTRRAQVRRRARDGACGRCSRTGAPAADLRGRRTGPPGRSRPAASRRSAGGCGAGRGGGRGRGSDGGCSRASGSRKFRPAAGFAVCAVVLALALQGGCQGGRGSFGGCYSTGCQGDSSDASNPLVPASVRVSVRGRLKTKQAPCPPDHACRNSVVISLNDRGNATCSHARRSIDRPAKVASRVTTTAKWHRGGRGRSQASGTGQRAAPDRADFISLMRAETSR